MSLLSCLDLDDCVCAGMRVCSVLGVFLTCLAFLPSGLDTQNSHFILESVLPVNTYTYIHTQYRQLHNSTLHRESTCFIRLYTIPLGGRLSYD